jgi:dynein heavy chain
MENGCLKLFMFSSIWPPTLSSSLPTGPFQTAVKAGVEETPDALFRFFIDRVRSNLHIALCMSPVGDGLRVRCRM